MLECVDPPDAAMETLGELPEPWLNWYWNVYDPRCQVICEAVHGYDECQPST